MDVSIQEVTILYETQIASVQLVEKVIQSSKFKYSKLKFSELDLKKISSQVSGLPLIIRSIDKCAVDFVIYCISVSLPYVFYIDDNFWELDNKGALGAYYHHPFIREGLNFIVKNAACIICNSHLLGEYIKKYNPRVDVLPPMFDFSLIDNLGVTKSNEIRIGFAGSVTRKKDINFLNDVIPVILERHKNVAFEFIGVAPEGIKFDSRIRFFPALESYDEYVKFQMSRHWSIGLAPLIGSVSDNYKTNNKFREYAAFGIAGIYSSSPVYRGSLAHGITGMECDNLDPNEWNDAIECLITNEEFRKEIVLSAFKFAKENYAIDVISECWYQSLFNASKFLVLPSKYLPVRYGSFYKLRWVLFLYKTKSNEILKNEGVKSFFVHSLKFLKKRFLS